nr:hypothetical protein [Mycoplasmopsis bovis]
MKKLKKLKMIKEKNLELWEHCSSSFWNETGGIFGRERLVFAYIMLKINK